MKEKLNIGNKSRQGDLRIEVVDKIPKDAKKVDSLVIAEGETTGHKHQVRPIQGTITIYDMPQMVKYVEVPKGGMAELIHEEHGTIQLPEGVHQISIQKQYDYLKEQARRVAD